ncbi:hypothetical protein [Catenulispora rubra]|uniref:hypothetical protein n=1 Tax=Catenulispora rubra TaxID=280293 RepID=UPI001892330C|nr:hypothetical protein [Catenulispora rubra]
MPSPQGTVRVGSGIPDQTLVSFHDLLRMAIRHRRLTLQVVCKRLAARGYPIGVSTLGDWQHGKARPASVPAVQALEEVLGLPHQALTDLIPRTELSERHGALGELLDEWPGARERTVDVLSHHDRAWVNEIGQVWRIASRMVVRARRDGVDRYVLRHFADPGSALNRIDLEAVANCTVGQVRWHAHEPVMVAELRFGQRLKANETWLLEYRWTNPTGEPSSLLAHAVRHRTEQYIMEIVFDRAALPVACHAFVQSDLYKPIRPTTALEVNSHHTVHLIGTSLLTGVQGISWRLPT